MKYSNRMITYLIGAAAVAVVMVEPDFTGVPATLSFSM